MIQQIEEISLNAWPALESIYFDGWLIRFANGLTKRSNSVNIINNSSIDLNIKINYCESLYRLKELPVCFKISQNPISQKLENILIDQGYEHISDIEVQLLSMANHKNELSKSLIIKEEADTEWMQHCAELFEMNSIYSLTFRKIIERIHFPKCLIRIMENNKTIGCGLGVLNNKYLGLFDIVVHKEYRNKGIGRILVNNILSWGKSNGANIAYLQVLTNNLPAIQLYNNLGFKTSYKYWYMIKNDP